MNGKTESQKKTLRLLTLSREYPSNIPNVFNCSVYLSRISDELRIIREMFKHIIELDCSQ